MSLLVSLAIRLITGDRMSPPTRQLLAVIMGWKPC
jgi:hypothetical protein